MSKKNQQSVDDLPQEVKDYYKSERRQKTGVAWLLAIGTLLLTLAVAAALFFGGSWLWNTLTGNGDGTSETASTQTESNDQQVASDVDATQGGQDDTATTAGADNDSSDANGGTTALPSDGTDTGVSDEQTNAEIPLTGDDTEPETLINTGPGDEELPLDGN